MSEDSNLTNRSKETPQLWSERVAALAVDALRYPKIAQRNDLGRSIAIVAEEIYARLCVRDYPPPFESSPPSNDA
jgi:hypothetical protein